MNRYREIARISENELGSPPIHHTCWIADLLEEQGLTRGPAPNRQHPRRVRCPARMRPWLLEAIRRFRERHGL